RMQQFLGRFREPSRREVRRRVGRSCRFGRRPLSAAADREYPPDAMKRVVLLAAVAATSGLFASAATGDHGGQPTLAPAVTQAQFTSGVTAPPFDIRKIGAPIVKRVGTAWNVTLRFAGTAPGSASLAVTRGSERVQTFKFDAGTGVVTVGPFVLAQSGQYRFTLSVTS